MTPVLRGAWSDGKRLRRAVLVVGLATFAGIGAVMAATEGGANRLLGAAMALLALSFGIVIFGTRYVRAQTDDTADDVAVRTIEYRDQSRRGLVVRQSREQSAFALVGVVGLAVPCGLFALRADALAGLSGLSVYGNPLVVRTIGFVGLAFCSVMIVVTLSALRGRSALVLLVDGVLFPSPFGTVYVPWTALAGVETVTRHGAPQFGISVSDRAAIEWPWWAALTGRFTRFARGYDLVLPADGFAASAERVERVFRFLLDHPDERAQVAASAEPSTILRAAERDPAT